MSGAVLECVCSVRPSGVRPSECVPECARPERGLVPECARPSASAQCVRPECGLAPECVRPSTSRLVKFDVRDAGFGHLG